MSVVSMELPSEIVDKIFSFLQSHPKALLACSKAHPILSQIVEKYRFHHIIIHTGNTTEFAFSFKPPNLLRQLAETPQIAKYVAVLQIEFSRYHGYSEEIISLLPMFPVLECIMLPTPRSALSWQTDLPQSLRTAVENCLHLPTLQEVHVGDISFPLSILDNLANIKSLSLAGPPTEIEPEYLKITFPQIKCLAFEGFDHSDSEAFCTWAKHHIVGLRSLEYDLSCHDIILQVFEICSDTLESLYICLQHKRTPSRVCELDFSSLHHLQHLTIHAEIFVDREEMDDFNCSFLPKAVEILKTAPSLQQLTIEIYIEPGLLDESDLSPLSVLTESSLCVRHIDLYIYTGSPQHPVTYTKIRSLLAEHGLMKLVEQGELTVHPEETAPTLRRSYIPRECIIM